MQDPASYKPSVYYFRAALRSAETKADAIEVGLHAVAELEQLKEWVRARGLVPPKWHITQTEIDEKDWGEVIPFPTTSACVPMASSHEPISSLNTVQEPPTASTRPAH